MIVRARRWRLVYSLRMSTNWLSPAIWTAFLFVFLYFLYQQFVNGSPLLAIAPVLFSVALICHGLRAFVTNDWQRRSLTIAGYVLMVCSFAASMRFYVTG